MAIVRRAQQLLVGVVHRDGLRIQHAAIDVSAID